MLRLIAFFTPAMHTTKFVLLSLIVFFSCSEKKTTTSSIEFEKGKELKELKDKTLSELSGLATSYSNPNYLWTINDSGNDNKIFLIDENLHIKLTCILNGVVNRDWEDIAVGPGPDSTKSYVYVADIGDNEAIYPLKYIYRFEEPQANDSTQEFTITQFDTITVTLADKQKDTEALLINPLNRNLYIVSKREEPVHVYELKYPYSTKDTLVIESIVSIPVTQIVAGDFSADGKEILMKNYNNIYYWPNDNQKSLATVLQEKPIEIPYKVEPQGESITWARDCSGFYTISEMNKGKKSFLYFYKRK